MNQFQLIEIIGNKDVVTIIQGYMCGTPLISLDDDDDYEIEDIQKAIELCRFKKKLRDVLRRQKLDNSLCFNNYTQGERRRFGIPDVEREPIYALMFKINNDDELLFRLISVKLREGLKFSKKIYSNKDGSLPSKVSLLVKFNRMQYIVYEIESYLYKFEIRDISCGWYKNYHNIF